MGDDVVGIEDRHVVRKIKVGSGDDAFAVLAEHHSDFLALFELEDDAFQIEKDVDHVFENAVDLGILMNDAGDLRFRGGKADHGGKKNAAQSIAERVAVAAFKRLERDDGTIGVLRINVNVDAGGLQESCISHL